MWVSRSVTARHLREVRLPRCIYTVNEPLSRMSRDDAPIPTEKSPLTSFQPCDSTS
eukprot:m.158212 g.158212  ORF g.158212 m.158212 type:complete len:56 (-) comp23689_c0_seq1:2209-2376(-)